jgi:hypothetical protein
VTKSNLRQAAARRHVLEGTRLYWLWRFVEEHGHEPGRSPAHDALALADIVLVQCAGDRDWARTTIDEIVGPAGGSAALRKLFERYLHLLWWYDCGRPRAPRRLPNSKRRELEAAVKLNASRASAARRRS